MSTLNYSDVSQLFLKKMGRKPLKIQKTSSIISKLYRSEIQAGISD